MTQRKRMRKRTNSFSHVWKTRRTISSRSRRTLTCSQKQPSRPSSLHTSKSPCPPSPRRAASSFSGGWTLATVSCPIRWRLKHRQPTTLLKASPTALISQSFPHFRLLAVVLVVFVVPPPIMCPMVAATMTPMMSSQCRAKGDTVADLAPNLIRRMEI